MDETTTRTLIVRDEVGDVGRVVVVAGPDRGAEVILHDESITVGSAESAGLQLSDSAVSRLHCRLELAPEGDRVTITDLHSKNGVWTEGCRVFSGQVRTGGRIRLGGTVLEFTAQSRVRPVHAWQGGDHFMGIYGQSRAMHQLFARLARIQDGAEPVLLCGELGTDTEDVARALHEASARRANPIESVSAATVGGSLADLELFGCVRGAYTGATRDHVGVFERADQGTVFIDEVGELPPDLQLKLLRVLERNTVRRLGDERERAVDVRVIASTRHSLESLVNKGMFREDLYYRLAVYVVSVPPLRERLSDIVPLAEQIVTEFTDDPAVYRLVRGQLQERQGYLWPANTLELRTFVRRLAMLGGSLGIEPEPLHGPATVRVDLPMSDARVEWLETFYRSYVSQVLQQCGGNVSKAAERAGVHRTHLSKLKTQYRVQTDED